ncbi:MAG: hypothetical protein ACXVBX_08160, partial [Flavisolibacter sp.]
EVATAYTNDSGDYAISFNYKLKPGQEYCYREEYYGIPYYHESSSGSGPILPGKTNILNVFAWKPVQLIVKVEVRNNSNTPLRIDCWFNGDKSLTAPESIYLKDTTVTCTLNTRPNSDVAMHFWYFTGPSYAPVLHDKVVPVRTTLADITPLSFIVDCSTF